MQKLDYKNLNEVIVHNQEEMDSIPEDFQGRIRLQDTTGRVYINKCYYLNVYVEAKASAVAWENSSVEARGNSSVEARENSSVVAWENSSVVAWENSSVVARGNSSVEARGNSSVVAWENSSVVAGGNVQVVDRSYDHKIKTSANARVVYMPHGLQEFINFFGIEVKNGVGTFYKAVRKDEAGLYHSDKKWDFIYEVGKVKKESDINRDTSEDCGKGIHISTLQFALNYGEDWRNLAILECQSKLEDIVCPDDTQGKVRTSRVKVVREVPLEECGVYGKILAKRLKRGVN